MTQVPSSYARLSLMLLAAALCFLKTQKLKHKRSLQRRLRSNLLGGSCYFLKWFSA
jgi:hypothetical protein